MTAPLTFAFARRHQVGEKLAKVDRLEQELARLRAETARSGDLDTLKSSVEQEKVGRGGAILAGSALPCISDFPTQSPAGGAQGLVVPTQGQRVGGAGNFCRDCYRTRYRTPLFTPLDLPPTPPPHPSPYPPQEEMLKTIQRLEQKHSE